MWVLILTLQFFVFIAAWNIRYPHETRFMLYELRKICLGEFLKGLDLSMIGFDSSDSSPAEEKVGEERIGVGQSILSIFGPTFTICSIGFIILVLSFILLSIICKRWCGKVIEKLRQRIFWNSYIRYTALNAMKLYLASLLAF